jgi:ELWxxDGT repeat protein
MRPLRPLVPFVLLLAAFAASGKPRLVPIAGADLVVPRSSNPASLLKAGAQIFFTADDRIHGAELWRSDGTAAGTSMVADLVPGAAASSPSLLRTLGSTVLFRTFAGSDDGVWSSDGTAAGTVKILPFPSNSSVTVIPAGTKVYITVGRSSSGPDDLWVSDGTAAGTRRVGAFGLSASSAFGADGKLYFTAADATVGTQFWISDGTLVGTHMIQRSQECPAQVACGPLPTSIFRIGSQVYFSTTAAGLWKTDGTPQGTMQVAQIPNASLNASSATAAYLHTATVLWRTDGTAAGTRSVDTAFSADGGLILDDGHLLYAHLDAGWEVWRSDATQAGTRKIGTLPIFNSSQRDVAPIVAVIGKRLFLTGWTAAAGYELWLGDADTGSLALLEDLDPRVTPSGPVSSLPSVGVELGGKVLFAASDVRGRELWESDGTADGTRLLMNIAAEAGGGIVSGTIRDAGTSAPIAGVTVRLCGGCIEPTVTDAGGRYRFEAVIAGSYTLVASRNGYIKQLYGGKECPCPTIDGTRITVSTGFETAGVDFALNPGGMITGKVTRLLTGAAVGAEVQIVDKDYFVFERTFSSGEGGAYRSPATLPTGTYYVEALPSPATGLTTVVGQRYGGVDCPFGGCNGPGGVPLSVTAGHEISGIDLPLNEYGSISGTVRDASGGAPIPGVQIHFKRADGESSIFDETTKTDDDGHYRSPPLNPGPYSVRAIATGFPLTFYPDCVRSCTATVTSSSNTNSTGIDFSMTPQRGRLAGIVRDSTGAPFPDIRLLLRPAGTGSAPFFGDTTSDTNGQYAFDDMPAGSYHLFALQEVYPHVDCGDFNDCDRTGATAIIVTEGQTTTLDFPLLRRPVTVTGRLLDATTGAPIVDEPANVYLEDQDQHSISDGRSVTFSGGNYSVTAITRESSLYVLASTGRHRLTAYPAARVICPGNTTCPVPAGAAAVPVSDPTGRDIRLVRYGSISGTVTDSRTGQPLRGASVRYVPTTAGRPAGDTDTDATGHYRWEQADGAYYVYVYAADSEGLQGQTYPGRNCGADSCVPATGDAVDAPEGVDVTGIDFHLQPLDSTSAVRISGRVVDAVTGIGMADVQVRATSTTQPSRGATTRTGAGGDYTLENSDPAGGLATGSYTLYASKGGVYYVALYGGTHCVQSSGCNLAGGTPVTVTAPDTTTGINFQMIRLTLTSVSPSEGSVSGGTSIAILGANFAPNATVTVGGRAATITSITPTRIVALTPPGVEGPAHVTVTLTPSLFSSLAHAFTYTPSPTQPRRRAVHGATLRGAALRGAGLRGAGS